MEKDNNKIKNIENIENIIRNLTVFTDFSTTYSLLSSIRKKYDNINKLIETMEKDSNNLEASLQVISEETEYMGSYANTTTKMVQDSIFTIRDILDILGQVEKQMNDIVNNIDPFREKFHEIDSIASQIFNIARMTENAARNTGIKAYHAGESGRGFEVIATEMADLARNAYSTTSKIPHIIEKIKNEVDGIGADVESVNENVVNIKEIDKEIEKLLSMIDSNIKKQMVISTNIGNVIDKQKDNRVKLEEINVDIRDMMESSVNMGERISIILSTQDNIREMYKKYSKTFFDMIESPLREYEWVEYTIDRIIKVVRVSSSISDQIFQVSSELNNMVGVQENKLKEFRNKLDDIEIEDRSIQEYSVEMEESIISLRRLLEKAIERMQEGIKFLVEIKDKIFAINDRIRSISNYMKDINVGTDNIQSLGKRAKLLSLYASIEAARAGAFSDSLSVIISQTDSLVEESAQSVALITKLSKEMISELSRIETMLSVVGKHIEKGEGKLSESINATEEIYNAGAELINLANEIEDNVGKQEEIIGTMINSQKDIQTLISDMKWEVSEIEKSVNNQKTENIVVVDKLIKERSSVNWKKKDSYTYRFYVNSTVEHLDPHRSTNVATSSVNSVMHRGLVSFDVNGNVIPAVSSRWDIMSNGKLWRFYIREDAYFHNGKKILAQDVVYSLKRILKGPNGRFIDMIRGAEKYIKGKTEDVAGMRVIDANTVEIELEYPYFLFITNLAVSSLAIIPYGSDPDKDKIGCGPYVFEKKTDSFIFKRFDNYLWGTPYFDKLSLKEDKSEGKEILSRFLKGEYHSFAPSIYMVDEVESKSLYREKVLSVPYYVTHYIGINSKNNSILKNKKIRQAIHYSIDKEEIVKEVYDGKYAVANTILPPGFPGYREGYKKYYYDPVKAKTLIEESQIDKKLLSITIAASSGGKRMEIIKKYLSEVGFKVKEKIYEKWSDFVSAVYDGNSELFLLAWAADLPEPENFFYPLFHTLNWGNKGNGFYYSNPQVDDLILAARKIRNREERFILYHKIEDMILEDAPIIPLNHTYKYIVYQPYIKNGTISPMNIMPYEDLWGMEESNEQ